MDLSKRDLILGAGGIAASFLAIDAAAETPASPPGSGHDMSGMATGWMGAETVAMLLYPKCTALDVIGPQYMFAGMLGAKVHLVAKTLEPVMTDTKVSILPTMTFADCPADLDILFAPGGSTGTVAAMRDAGTVAFFADRGQRAKLVTSVCTGSLILGKAGLLRGYKATSHWLTREHLSLFGAEPIDTRIVEDRNRITGAGVTAGLDFGLSIVKRLRGEDYAKALALLAEYDPQPPLNAGTPSKAGPQATALLKGMFKGLDDEVRKAAHS